MTIYDQINKNRRRTILLFFLFGLLLSVIIGLLSIIISIENGSINFDNLYSSFQFIGPIIIIFGIIWSIIAWYNGSKMIINLSGAKEIKKNDDPEIYRLIENLAISQGLPVPKLYIMEDDSLSAFATGRNPQTGIIVVTSGLKKILTKDEMEGVLAHELSHIKNYDTRVMLLAIVLVGILQLVADLVMRRLILGGGDRSENRNAGIYILVVIAIYVLGYFGSVLIQLAISRSREFLADADAGLMTRNPEGLINALNKISKDSRLEALDGKSSLAHLCIADPYVGNKQSISQKIGNLFATHPPINERIKALREGGF